MADTLITSDELKIENLFVDGDTRTITLKNPAESITSAQIQSLEELILNGGSSTLLIGDRYGSAFSRIQTVTRQTDNTITLDIS